MPRDIDYSSPVTHITYHIACHAALRRARTILSDVTSTRSPQQFVYHEAILLPSIQQRASSVTGHYVGAATRLKALASFVIRD